MFSNAPAETSHMSDASPAVSRELATVGTCNQVTLQKPRDVGIICTAGQDDYKQQLSCLEKKIRKRKPRRGKKKNRKFLSKGSCADPSHDQLTKSINVNGIKYDHGKLGHTYNLSSNASDVEKYGYHGDQRSPTDIANHNNYSNIANNSKVTLSDDAKVVSLANHSSTSEVVGHYNVVSIGNNVVLNHNINQAGTSATQHTTQISSGHSEDFTRAKTDGYNREDLLILLEKENGVSYAVCKGEDRLLGRGGFGIVYKGFKLEGSTKTPVAIKVVEKSNVDCFVEDYELGFVPEEVAMLNKIKSHPNAIQLVDYVQIYDFVAIIMERPVHCKDLFDILAQQTSIMSEIHAREIMKQLSGVLLAMEKKGIVHRDIKSENILVDLDNEQVKLIDFGLATTCTPGKTMKEFSGTRENTPPEYILNGEYEGPKEAVWTLGLLLYYLVCGEEPFGSFPETMKPLRTPSFLSSDLKDLLLGMLRKNPNRRFTLDQVHHHPWLTCQTNYVCLPFGCRRSLK